MIDSSYLLNLYGLSSGATGGGSLLGATGKLKKGQPTAPWAPTANVPDASALVRQALGGRRFINESAVSVDQAGASADYRKLFALYQGMDTLTALAARASTKGVPATELALLNKRFGSGMDEIAGYLGQTSFDDFRVVQGATSSLSKSTAGVARDSAKSITGPIHEGSLTTPVAAFEGDVRFSVKVEKMAGATITGTVQVDMDLSEMGATERTLTNVIGYLNGKLEAAGVQARIGREQIKAEPRTLEVNGKTVTLPAGADRWALLVRGSSVETLEFMAPETSDAVYVVQASGTGATAGHQLLKFQSDGGAAPDAQVRTGETQWVDGRLSQSSMIDGIETVRASATAADGSLWVLADLSQGQADQPIKGQRDVALIKYDSAGRVVFTRTLGAADQANGFALSIAEDGRVAVAGSVIGALDQGKAGEAAGVSDSFVTVYDDDGKELWTQRRGARGADEATSVVFGEDGMVYVAGRTQTAMSGGVSNGGWDGYLQAFSQTQAHQFAPVIATPSGVTQFGTSGTDDVQAMAIDGSNLVTAGVENGRAVLRTYTIGSDGRPALAETRDLGAMSGDIAGVSISDGKIIIAGTTRNAALTADTVNSAHSGGKDAFVMSIDYASATLGGSRVSYYGSAGDDTIADVKVQDGKVWISGVANRSEVAKADDPTEAYLTRIDPETGAVEWTRTWKGDGQQASPAAIAVAKDGASILDRLGLPTGKISQSDSKNLVEATSLRVGDRFYVSPADGGRPTAVTIEARDTLATLARKIEQASRMTLKVSLVSEGGEVTGKDGETVTTAGGFQRLSIMGRNGKSAVISSGEVGRDALAGLGLAPGFIGQTSAEEDERKTYGLDLPRNLSLSSAEAVKATLEKLQQAMSTLRTVYRDINPDKVEPLKGQGQAPAYLTNQIANYQAALARLTGG